MKSQALKIQENIILAPYTTFKIGGPARFFVEVESEEELADAVRFAVGEGVPIFVMGGGSNILVSDDGFRGLVIRLKNNSQGIRLMSENPHPVIECWAGESLGSVVNYAARNNYAGLEWAVGIPGTIGGAARGNAGAYGSSMHDLASSVRFINIGKIDGDKMQIESYRCQDCDFSYRHSIFKDNPGLLVISVTLTLKKGDGDEIPRKMKEVIRKRTEKIPKDPSPGSFFQNPIVKNKGLQERFQKDSGKICQDGRVPAPWLIEEAGIKGKKIGNVQVSEKHANFVVNLGGATASEVVIMASYIKQQVRDQLGVELQEEIEYVGF